MAATVQRDEKVAAEAAKKELFFCHPLSPGCLFFLPHGTRVYNKLIDFMRKNHNRINGGYEEVKSPNIYNMKLWDTSQYYKEKMFSLEVDKQEFGLKPTNCPAHCLIFQHRVRSHNELPLRLADFGALHHRSEANCSSDDGIFTGLEHGRRFQQDDAHIFCKTSQIKVEVLAILKLIDHTYNEVFRFANYELKLCTRPPRKEYMGGELVTWEKAEYALNDALEDFKKPWRKHECEEGASFCGPKIDIYVSDSSGRRFQCGSLQLDFQLPDRFKLEYATKKEGKKKRPVLIHRTILGESLERMLGILLEHYKGNWPFWLNPRQVIVCSASGEESESYNYAKQVWKQVQQAGYYIDIDETDRDIDEKVEEAQRARYNYTLVVGEEEVQTGLVGVKMRDEARYSSMSMEKLLAHFKDEVASFH